MEFAGLHILITGTTSGIGRALAVKFSALGAEVSSFDRSEQSGDPWRRIHADITQGDQVAAAARSLPRPVDILINNAGVMSRGEILDSTEDEYDLLMDVHVKGSWLVAKNVVPGMPAGGTLVQMSSRHGLSLPQDPALYGLSKRWSMDLAEMIARTYPQIRLKLLCPGPVDTPLTRVGANEAALKAKQPMMTTPEQIAERIIELLGRDDKSRLLFDQRTYAYFLE